MSELEKITMALNAYGFDYDLSHNPIEADDLREGTTEYINRFFACLRLGGVFVEDRIEFAKKYNAMMPFSVEYYTPEFYIRDVCRYVLANASVSPYDALMPWAAYAQEV